MKRIEQDEEIRALEERVAVIEKKLEMVTLTLGGLADFGKTTHNRIELLEAHNLLDLHRV